VIINLGKAPLLLGDSRAAFVRGNNHGRRWLSINPRHSSWPQTLKSATNNQGYIKHFADRRHHDGSRDVLVDRCESGFGGRSELN